MYVCMKVSCVYSVVYIVFMKGRGSYEVVPLLNLLSAMHPPPPPVA